MIILTLNHPESQLRGHVGSFIFFTFSFLADITLLCPNCVRTQRRTFLFFSRIFISLGSFHSPALDFNLVFIYFAVLYCTVLYCTGFRGCGRIWLPSISCQYCTVLYCTVLYSVPGCGRIWSPSISCRPPLAPLSRCQNYHTADTQPAQNIDSTFTDHSKQ